jgi:hypothetical protein
VVDIKGELYEKSRRPHAYVFNPLKADALGYDPFYLLHGSADIIPEVRDIALTLCPLPPDTREPFWNQAAQNILTGHLLYSFRQGKSFSEALRLLQSIPAKVLMEVESKDADAKMFFLQYWGLKEQALASIMAELSNKVMPFAVDPHIQATLSKQDIITPELLEQGHDIFLQIPEYKLEQWKPLVSLVVQQFCRHFERRPEGSATPILFLLDEFPRLGKMDVVVNGLTTLRSKKLTILLIIQSLAQLDATYGHDQRKVIADNCVYKVILQATDAETQQYFSKLVGTEERVKVTRTTSASILLFSKNPDSTSTTTEEKPIIKPEEFATLNCIVILSPHGLVFVQKWPYYLAGMPPPTIAPPLMQPAALPTYQQGYQGKQAVTTAPPGAATQQAAQPPPNLTVQFEAALTTLVKSAKAGTPLETLAHDFAARMSPALRSQFTAWWQQRQQWERVAEAQGVETRVAAPPAQQPEQPRTPSPQPMNVFEAREQAQRSRQVLPGSPQAENPSARYEAVLQVAAQHASPGTPLAQVIRSFAETLPAAEHASFLAWWQQRQQHQPQEQAITPEQTTPGAAAAPEPEQAENLYAQYEFALATFAQYAPQGTPLEQLAQDFSARLSPVMRNQFAV